MSKIKEYQKLSEEIDNQKRIVDFCAKSIALKNNLFIIIFLFMFLPFAYLLSDNIPFFNVFFNIYYYCWIFYFIFNSFLCLIDNISFIRQSPKYYKDNLFHSILTVKNKIKEEKKLSDLENKQFKFIQSFNVNDIENNKALFLKTNGNNKSNLKFKILVSKRLDEINKLEKNNESISNYDIKKHQELKSAMSFFYRIDDFQFKCIVSIAFCFFLISIATSFVGDNEIYFFTKLFGIFCLNIILFFIYTYFCFYRPFKKELNIMAKKKDVINELNEIEEKITLTDIKSVLMNGSYNDIKFIFPYYDKLKDSMIGSNEIEQWLLESNVKTQKTNNRNKNIEIN